MKLDPEVKEAILAAPPGDPREIALTLSKRLGKVVPIQAVVQIRGSMKRAENVARAKEQASDSLTDNIALMAHAKKKLLNLFDTETLPLKDRIEVSKELRQWTAMETKAAGIEDAETDTVFVIGGEWDMTPENG